ncbi:MAG: VWA domain-containing protein [Pseudohongiellaceae bacterium]
MKDLFRKNTGRDPARQADKPAAADKRAVQDFLNKVAAIPVQQGDARLIFALDATASRQHTWDQASQLQTEMFLSTKALGGLQVQLCYFRGFAEFHSSNWHIETGPLLQQMSSIHCQAGITQIERLLQHVIAENRRKRVKCVIFIGDSMEESLDKLCHLAGQLGMLNIPLFIFQERQDPVARQAFTEMARLSKGACCQFDSSSADQLKELLRAVAIYAAGGLKALQDLGKTSHQAVRLLQQLK